MELTWLWLLLGGAGAGVINAVAGGGALLLFPLLLQLGITPLAANATTSIAMGPGALASAYAYRHHLKLLPRRYFWLLAPCLIGGGIGGSLVEHSRDSAFSALVPWSILFAAGLLAVQPLIHTLLHTRRYLKLKQLHRHGIFAAVFVGMLVVSVYGGYFSAGFGILMLAILGLSEIKDMQQLNGLKNLTSITIHLISGVLFIMAGFIDWHVFIWLLLGNIAGGWAGAHFSARLPAHFIHAAIIAIGLVVAGILFTQL